MKKSHFFTLIIGVAAGLVFALGMCMCLLPEWGAFNQGVILTAAGGAVLAVMGIVALVKATRDMGPVNWGLILKVVFAVVALLVLGLGMCMIMLWDMMMTGILIGIVGIIMILCLIPMFFGFRS